MRIADFSDPHLDNFMGLVFDNAERQTGDYRFSQAIAEIVERHEYSGMLVPGVQGNPTQRYNNLILFQPEARWRDWLNRGRSPERINDILDPR